MKPVAREWIQKADEDFFSARGLLRHRTRPNHDLICFLSQQCIEKYLKARLQAAGIRFDRTHDLERLLDQLRPVEPFWAAHKQELRPLTAYAVVFRYPGRTASRAEAREAVQRARKFRSIVRESLGLPTAIRESEKRPTRRPGRTRRATRK
jgi:HEPN domain-containing protein